jgi:hypothetical protein
MHINLHNTKAATPLAFAGADPRDGIAAGGNSGTR